MSSAPLPELLDLMEHEKVIEQGLHTFVDVGCALLAIRDGRKYLAAGYTTFEDYCQRRWNMSRSRGHRLIGAAETIAVLSPIGDIPTTESQLRPLAALPLEERADAWAQAVAEADGMPTAAVVQRVVDRHRLSVSRKQHPAPFSDAILTVAARHLREFHEPPGLIAVLDPFAGTGRIHDLPALDFVERTVGVELEPEWAAMHSDTICGDALALVDMFGRGSFDAIVTSPTYGNRMADHHDAADDSVRPTYKHTLGRDLAPTNSGQMQWGDDYRDFHHRAWGQAVAVVRPGGTFTLNVKNHIRGGEIQHVAEWHIDELCRVHGLVLEVFDVVDTRGLMAGENHTVRVGHEIVATFRKECP